MKRTPLLAIAIGTVLAGCGGGGGRSSSDSSANHSASVGIASISYKGRFVPAAVFSLDGVTVTSMAGANFTNVQLNPAPKIENSALVFAMGGEIWTYKNGIQTQITHALPVFDHPQLSKNGLVVCIGPDEGTGINQLFTCLLDGSNFRQITSAPHDHLVPSFSPSGSKIVYSDGIQLYTVNSDGTGEVPLSISNPNYTNGTAYSPAWSPDGATILFTGTSSDLGEATLFMVPSGGGAATETGWKDIGFPHWSPDGRNVVLMAQATSTIWIFGVDHPNNGFALATPPSGTVFADPSFTPDGNSIVFQAYNSSTGSIDTQLLGSPASLAPIVAYSSPQLPYTPSWSPYFGAKSFIGSGGQMSAAAGFIWAQVGDGFGGFASISAATPASFSLERQPEGTSGGPVVYLAKADKITKIVYSNSYFAANNAITPANSKQALISVSSVTGQIDTVAPLAEPGLTPSNRGGLAYDGTFAAIYDSHGKNLAPSGASHIEIAPKTGAVSSWY